MKQKQAELARVTRAVTLGELTASLAHELNQPLTGIVSNAQAGERWLAGDTPDVDEARAVLADIAEDGKRAGDVIRRLRMVLWKQWRSGPNRFAQLRKRGVSHAHAAIAAGAKSGYWRMSRHVTVQQALPNAYFYALGLPRLETAYRA